MKEECVQIEKQLVWYLENQLTEIERNRVLNHLSRCEDCRATLDEDAWLTGMLFAESEDEQFDHAPKTYQFLPGAGNLFVPAAITLVIIIIASIFITNGNRNQTFGVIDSQKLSPTLSVETSEVAPLSATNHIQVPAGTKIEVEISNLGRVRASGPALFELDWIGKTWRLILLHGVVVIELDEGKSLDVVSNYGHQIVTTRFAIVDDTGIVEQTPNRDMLRSPAQTFDAALAAFFEGEDLEAAANLLHETVDHESSKYELKSRSLFYLAAAYSRLEEYESAKTTAMRWYELNPGKYNDTLASIVITALWQADLRVEARQFYEEQLKHRPATPWSSVQLGNDHQNDSKSPHQEYFERFFNEIDQINANSQGP